MLIDGYMYITDTLTISDVVPLAFVPATFNSDLSGFYGHPAILGLIVFSIAGYLIPAAIKRLVSIA